MILLKNGKENTDIARSKPVLMDATLEPGKEDAPIMSN